MTSRDHRALSAGADERYHGHVGAADYVPHALWLALIGLFTIPAGFELSVAPWSWFLAGVGVLLIASAFGIWRASEWARITSGVLVLALAGAFFWFCFLYATQRDDYHGHGSPFSLWFTLAVLGGLVGTGLGLLSPMAARRFRRAREFRSIPQGKWH